MLIEGVKHNKTKCYNYNKLEYTLQRKSHLCIPRKGLARPPSQFPHSCVCERFIYSQDRSTYFPAAELWQTDPWEYINHSQTIPFLGIFISNFRYCVFAVHTNPTVKFALMDRDLNFFIILLLSQEKIWI
jgi:hypothetical protein